MKENKEKTYGNLTQSMWILKQGRLFLLIDLLIKNNNTSDPRKLGLNLSDTIKF